LVIFLIVKQDHLRYLKPSTMKTILNRQITVAIILLSVWIGLWFFHESAGRYLVRSVYEESLPISALNDVMAGRSVHSLPYYITCADLFWFSLSKKILLAFFLVQVIAVFVDIKKYYPVTFKKMMISICSLAVLFLLVEWSFRSLDRRGFHAERKHNWSHALLGPNEKWPWLVRQFRPNSTFSFQYDGNPRGYFDENGLITYHVNNYGFRDDDYSPEKVPGVKRIIVLGDSFAFGEGVKREEIFCQRLERLLNDAGESVEVLNFSVGGWSTRDEIAYLKHIGLSFSPDLVLVAYVLNDADYTDGLDVWAEFANKCEAPSLKWSYFLSYTFAKLGQGVHVKNYVNGMITRSAKDAGKWDVSFNALIEGKKLAEENQARFAVVILPFMYQLTEDHAFLPIHRMISAHCVSNEIPVHDVLPALIGQPHELLWVHASDPHPNEIAHQIFAQEINQFIQDEKLLTPMKRKSR